MQIWIHLQVWVLRPDSQQTGSGLLLRLRNAFAMVWKEDKLCFSFTASSLYRCILFFSTLSVFTFIRYLFQPFSLCLPQILPGKLLPPMMFPWWLVRSSAKLTSLAGVLLCFWPCAMLWQFVMGRTVQHSADANLVALTHIELCRFTPTESLHSPCFFPPVLC